MRSPPFLATLVGIALAICATAAAGDPPTKQQKITRCVKYSQKRGTDQQSVSVGLRNRCRYDVSCTIEWKVSCEDDDPDTTPREEAHTVDLDRGASESLRASAAVCGDGDWAVDDIRWHCEPR